MSSRPSVVIDARMVGPVGHGVARYVQLLAEGLGRLREKTGELPYELVFLVDEKHSSPEQLIPGFRTEGVSAPFLSPTEWIALPSVLKKLKGALYHSPSFASLPSCPCPWVVTVHDLIHLEYGSRSQKLYYNVLLKRFVRKAAAVATVSEFSRGEIARWAGISRDRIEIVWNAITRAERRGQDRGNPAILEEWGLQPGRYFLCLSNIKPHKNLPLLAKAYARYWERTKAGAWPLVVTAQGIEPGPGLRQLGPQDELYAQALLTGAGALIYPSLLEGFGRPPLEAAVEGVPTLVSDIPVHREALEFFEKDEVMWVPPSYVEGWVEAMSAASSGQLSPPSEATRERILSRYSTERMGQDMDRIYRRVLDLPCE